MNQSKIFFDTKKQIKVIIDTNLTKPYPAEVRNGDN